MTEKLQGQSKPDGWNVQIRGRLIPPDWAWERTTTQDFTTLRFDSTDKPEWWLEVTLSREELEFMFHNMNRCSEIVTLICEE